MLSRPANTLHFSVSYSPTPTLVIHRLSIFVTCHFRFCISSRVSLVAMATKALTMQHGRQTRRPPNLFAANEQENLNSQPLKHSHVFNPPALVGAPPNQAWARSCIVVTSQKASTRAAPGSVISRCYDYEMPNGLTLRLGSWEQVNVDSKAAACDSHRFWN